MVDGGQIQWAEVGRFAVWDICVANCIFISNKQVITHYGYYLIHTIRRIVQRMRASRESQFGVRVGGRTSCMCIQYATRYAWHSAGTFFAFADNARLNGTKHRQFRFFSKRRPSKRELGNLQKLKVPVQEQPVSLMQDQVSCASARLFSQSKDSSLRHSDENASSWNTSSFQSSKTTTRIASLYTSNLKPFYCISTGHLLYPRFC